MCLTRLDFPVEANKGGMDDAELFGMLSVMYESTMVKAPEVKAPVGVGEGSTPPPTTENVVENVVEGGGGGWSQTK